jgi:hypothetical protein
MSPWPEQQRDHALPGEWKDHRDCHINPDLVLIFRKPEEALQLVRSGLKSRSRLSARAARARAFLERLFGQHWGSPAEEHLESLSQLAEPAIAPRP